MGSVEVRKISVIGAGIMSRGIAQVSAQAGYETILYNVREATLNAAMATIKQNLEKGIAKGKVTPESMAAALNNLHPTTDMSNIRGSDLIIESVSEDVSLKKSIYSQVVSVCGANTIIATNTSSQSITELSSEVERKDLFIGMHFFNPVHIMKLIEIVRGLETSSDTVDVIKQVSIKMGKEIVEVNEAPGFITSRMNAVIGNEAFRMLEEGIASPEDIDKAIKLGLNHPMGPFEMIDLVGLDTRLKTMEYLHKSLGDRYLPSTLHRKYVLAGRFGRKTGKGIYDYGSGNKDRS